MIICTGLHFADRPETDGVRHASVMNLCGALWEDGRNEERLPLAKDLLATLLRVKGPDHELTIAAEEVLANALSAQGGEANLRRALKTLTHTYAWKSKTYGDDDEHTIRSLSGVAMTQEQLGMLSESIVLQRQVVARFRRVSGETSYSALRAECCLANTLVRSGHVDEARAILDRVLPVAARVLGPAHHVTRAFQKPNFLDPCRFDKN